MNITNNSRDNERNHESAIETYCLNTNVTRDLRTTRTCKKNPGIFLGSFSKSTWAFWDFFGIFFELIRNQGFFGDFFGIFLGFFWDFFGIFLDFCWDFFGIFSGIFLIFFGIFFQTQKIPEKSPKNP